MTASKKETGYTGEQAAKKYLIEKGYRFIASNFSYNRLEIDIVFEDDAEREIIFTEVKTRSSTRYGQPEEAIDRDKQKNIRTASAYFLRFNREFANHRRRFDSVSVLIENGEMKINHIKNAF